jgi:hypothetical protein
MSMRGALALIADIVAAVCHRRSSDLSSGFGCKNNSHSGKGNGSLALLPSLVIPPQIIDAPFDFCPTPFRISVYSFVKSLSILRASNSFISLWRGIGCVAPVRGL